MNISNVLNIRALPLAITEGQTAWAEGTCGLDVSGSVFITYSILKYQNLKLSSSKESELE